MYRLLLYMFQLCVCRYHKAKELIGDDPRWNGMDDAYREATYLRYLRDKRDRMREARRERRDENITAFKDLLIKYKVKVDTQPIPQPIDTPVFHFQLTTTYRKACYKLQGLDDYEALDRLDRLTVFESYVRELEKAYHDEQDKEEGMEKRRARKARDAFKELLQQHISDGRINAKTR